MLVRKGGNEIDRESAHNHGGREFRGRRKKKKR